MSSENFDPNKVYFIVNDGNKVVYRNFWAFDNTEIDNVQYRYPNEFTIVITSSVKYVCFVPYNIDHNAKVKAAANITAIYNLDSTVMITYQDKEIEMKEGFIYKCNETSKTGFDEIPVPKGISFKTYIKDNAKLVFTNKSGNREFFSEPLYSTFANGDKFILNKFYWTLDEGSNLGIFQEFILRKTYNEHQYILLRKYAIASNNKALQIGCFVRVRDYDHEYTKRNIYPSRVIIGYPDKKTDGYGIAFNLIDSQQTSGYVITKLGLEIFNDTNDD